MLRQKSLKKSGLEELSEQSGDSDPFVQEKGYKLKTTKTVSINGTKTLNKTVKNLKSKKKYHVRVRSFKTVNNKKYYSKWSSKKSVITK